jgi:Ser/Thr protein kinase RdoA (MazF antagonist)
MEEQIITGNQNRIRIRDGVVHRPSHAWSDGIKCLLQFCRTEGLEFVPEWRGRDEQGNEIFEYIDGEVGNYPLPEFLKSVTAIVSAAKTLRRFHDVTAKLVGKEALQLQFEAVDPIQVVCHGDFAPYNCVFDHQGNIKGVIDFDGARLGPKIWDLAYAIYRFVPFVDFGNADDGFGGLTNRLDRLKIFFDTYEASREERIAAVRLLPRRLLALLDWMYQEAANGNAGCVQNLRDKHHELYLRDIRALTWLYEAI